MALWHERERHLARAAQAAQAAAALRAPVQAVQAPQNSSGLGVLLIGAALGLALRYARADKAGRKAQRQQVLRMARGGGRVFSDLLARLRRNGSGAVGAAVEPEGLAGRIIAEHEAKSSGSEAEGEESEASEAGSEAGKLASGARRASAAGSSALALRPSAELLQAAERAKKLAGTPAAARAEVALYHAYLAAEKAPTVAAGEMEKLERWESDTDAVKRYVQSSLGAISAALESRSAPLNSEIEAIVRQAFKLANDERAAAEAEGASAKQRAKHWSRADAYVHTAQELLEEAREEAATMPVPEPPGELEEAAAAAPASLPNPHGAPESLGPHERPEKCEYATGETHPTLNGATNRVREALKAMPEVLRRVDTKGTPKKVLRRVFYNLFRVCHVDKGHPGSSGAQTAQMNADFAKLLMFFDDSDSSWEKTRIDQILGVPQPRPDR